MPKTRGWWLALLVWLLAALVGAEDTQELARNNPVAIISLVQGQAELRHPEGDWEPAYWLSLLRPEDELRTPQGAKVLVDFFADDHLEIVDSDAQAKVAFKGLSKQSGSGGVRREKARDRAVSEIPIPYMLERKLASKDFEGSKDEGAMDRENTFLAAAVQPQLFPPLFNWKNVGAPLYRLQLFNEWNEVIYESKVKTNRFKYPYTAPFQLAKNSQYFWQVLTPDDTIVVRKYPFTLLTTLHARELDRSEVNFERLKKQKKLMQNHYTDMFLLYNNRKLIDRLIALLRTMARMDPENPLIYRALVRAYLAKGCPAHAEEALEKEKQLNGVDPMFD